MVKKTIGTRLAILGTALTAVFIFAPRLGAHASSIPCPPPDSGLSCGFTSPYNMGDDTCKISGSDIEPIGRILGGQVCTLGSLNGDQAGYYNPSGGTSPAYPLSGSVPPGWTYAKTNPISKIPNGAFTDSYPYYTYGFFGGTASVNLYPPDDAASVSIGSQSVSWSGCTCTPSDVYQPSCPSQNFSGSPTMGLTGGETVQMSVTNMCRPNNGYGQWGGGDLNITLQNVTYCYTAAYITYLNSLGGAQYNNVTDYTATAPGVCTPSSGSGTGTITVTSKNAVTGQPVKASWKFSPNGFPDPCSGHGGTCTGVSSSTYTNVAAGGPYAPIPISTSDPSGAYTLRVLKDQNIAQDKNPTIIGTLLAFVKNVLTSIARAATVNPISGYVTKGGTLSFTISWDPTAAMSVNPTSVVLQSSNSYTTSVSVTNTGTPGSQLSWSVSGPLPAWLTSPSVGVSGVLNAGNSASLAVSGDPSKCAISPCTANITFTGTSIVGKKIPLPSATVAVTLNKSGGSSPSIDFFTATPGTVSLGGATTLTWGTSNITSCTASTATPEADWTGPKGISGAQSVTPPSLPSQTYILNCVGPSGSASKSVPVTVTAATVPLISMSASPSSILVGGLSGISWSITNQASACAQGGCTCSATGAWSGSKPTSFSNWLVAPQGSAGTVDTYGLTCTGPGGSGFGSATVSITGGGGGGPCTISASPSSGNAPLSGSLSWSANDNSAFCTLAPSSCAPWGHIGVFPPTGGTTYGPLNGNTTCVLTCKVGNSCQVPISVTVTSPLWSCSNGCAAPIAGGLYASAAACSAACVVPITLTVSPASTVPVGTAVTVTASGGTPPYSWSAPGASGVSISGPGNNTLHLTYSSSGSYTVTVHDAVGASKSTTITAFSCTFSANPSTIVPPTSSNLQWTCLNAVPVSCSINGTSMVGHESLTGTTLNGNFSVTPTTTTVYGLSCSAGGGPAFTVTTTVNVSSPYIRECNPGQTGCPKP